MQIMFSGLTPGSRQRKFCEGFLFFPIRNLQKYGNFIYRQYGRKAGIKVLLEMKMGLLDYNTMYAEEIHRCITDKAMSQATKVLDRTEDFYARVTTATGNMPAIHHDFNELIIHFYREVSIYNNVVLHNLKEELKQVLKPGKGDSGQAPGHEHISKVTRLVKEFMLQTKTILALIDDFVEENSIQAAGYPAVQLAALQTDIREMYMHQQKISSLLKRWKEEQDLHGLQTYYN